MKGNELTFVKRKYNPAIKEFLESLSKTPHVNFPVIVEVSDDFYVMEYIQGKTLHETISEGYLPHDEAKKLLLQLLDAVELLHKFKIVHRDIKPENIIITEDGTLKLIDFDIARKIVTAKIRDTQILGTAGYAAPEQFGFTQTDERSDIYAIGIVYNYMLTGKLPAEELADGQTGKIIEKCIQVDKSKRYKNINLLRKDVKANIYTAHKLFDILPGFRTKNPYKMAFATASYFLFVVMYAIFLIDQAPRSASIDTFMFYIVVLFVVLYAFLFFSVLTNFMNVVDRIKFPLKKRWQKQVALLLIIYLVGIAIFIAILGDVRDGFMYNPVNVCIILYGYILYSLIHDLIFGML